MELGLTEQYVADELNEHIKNALKSAQELVKDLEKCEDTDWTHALLDVETKEHVMKLLPMVKQLASNLSAARLITIILEVVANDKDKD